MKYGERGEACGHGEVVLPEGCGVDDDTVERGEDGVVCGAVGEYGGDGDVSAGECFGEAEDVGFDVVVLACEEFAGSSETCLYFIGDEEGSVFLAEFGGGGEVVIIRDEYAFALNGFDDECGGVVFLEFMLEGAEVVEGDGCGICEEMSEA